VSLLSESVQVYFERGFTVGYQLVRAQENLGWPFTDPFRDEAFWTIHNVPRIICRTAALSGWTEAGGVTL
jgi:hypothetical protein